jgi:glycosyltransferase involved in cell wall biosynthesis
MLSLRYAYDELLPTTATDAEQVLCTVSALARRGVGVELVVPSPRGNPHPTVEVLSAYYQVEGPFTVRALDSHFDRSRPLQKAAHAVSAMRFGGHFDVLYTRNLAALATGLAAGHPVAYEHYRPWPDQYPLLRPLLRRLMCHDRFLGAMLHSEHALESFARHGIPRSRLRVMHNGYDPKRLEPRLDKTAARSRLGLKAKDPIVTYAGRMNERKGLDSILAMAEACPDVTFLLVGSEGDGTVEAAARSLANVKVHPWQPFDKTVVYLYAADVLIIPPSSAPLHGFGTTVLPMKLFLYLAAGRPVLAPRAPDTRELLRPGHNALLVEPGNTGSAVSALRSLLADPALARRLGDAGAASVATLTWDARAARIERFLLDRLAARK